MENLTNKQYWNLMVNGTKTIYQPHITYNEPWPYKHFYTCTKVKNHLMCKVNPNKNIGIIELNIENILKAFYVIYEAEKSSIYKTSQNKTEEELLGALKTLYIDNKEFLIFHSDNTNNFTYFKDWFLTELSEDIWIQGIAPTDAYIEYSELQSLNLTLLTGMSELEFFKKLVIEDKIDLFEYTKNIDYKTDHVTTLFKDFVAN
jgi:hypothetical protein